MRKPVVGPTSFSNLNGKKNSVTPDQHFTSSNTEVDFYVLVTGTRSNRKWDGHVKSKTGTDCVVDLTCWKASSSVGGGGETISTTVTNQETNEVSTPVTQDNVVTDPVGFEEKPRY